MASHRRGGVARITLGAVLFGKRFFPRLILPAFINGLHVAFYVSAVLALIAAVASLLSGQRTVYGEP